MNKIIKIGLATFVGCLILTKACWAEEATEKATTNAAAEKVESAPVTKALPIAPTIKDLAEKQESDEAVLKKLVEAPVAGPYDEYNRSTPRSSLVALALAVKEEDYKRAVNYLDLRNLPFSLDKELDGEALIKQLVIVAKRAMQIDFEDVSDDPLGYKDDGLPSYRDRITTLKTKNGNVDILMQRVPRKDGVFIWKISNATVSIIPALNDEFGYGLIGNKLSEIFPHYIIMGFEIWQLVMLVGLIIFSYACAYVLTYLVLKLIQVNQRFNKQRLQKFIAGPLRFLILVLIFRAFFDLIAPSLTARALFEAKTFLVLAIYWVMLGVVEVVINRLADRMRKNGQDDAIVLLRPASTGIKLIITLLAIITWMDNLGYEVTTILAGLGVGGIAVALAAQKSLENLIGSITIYTSQPVRVGDFCQFENTLGTVEEIGLRATQLRTLARTVVHIPNALFASGKIENLTQRDKILYRTRLHLSLDDTPEQVRSVLEKIRGYISSNEIIDGDNSRIRFLEFGDYAQELELYVYVKTSDFAVYLEHREEINLALSDIIEGCGVSLIVPTKASYIKEEPVKPEA